MYYSTCINKNVQLKTNDIYIVTIYFTISFILCIINEQNNTHLKPLIVEICIY